MQTAPARLACVSGAGLGLRRELLAPLADRSADPAAGIGFMEVAPENWLQIGGRLGRQFRAYTERFPFVCHGLSLSIGSPAPLDVAFVKRVRTFLDAHGIHDYSEHLTWTGDEGQVYDLLPIPFTEAAVHHVAARVRQAQDLLGRRIALENASYYAPLATELSEAQFITAVLEEADCDLLLDVNNVYVNSVNHGYDPLAFMDQLPLARVRYLHMAGHYTESPTLLVDTHGADVIDPVWDLLDATYARLGPVPTLLERDFNLPPLPKIFDELSGIRTRQARAVPARATAPETA
ncbi:MAG: DUF692 domain-containing protein [Pseudomonadota bacterium]|jgi:uncharacterized protein (UPF0276 family)|nr:DUF692 domain-containing protein [Gammaproteobacteria bacterium]MEC8848032.1 DUF692 domain-containing protein [Pseudomonadota bacterium]|tara:strand:- start:27973 stop:28848 length:876 start_codon:yes stop_codon:yes gene_type:complete